MLNAEDLDETVESWRLIKSINKPTSFPIVKIYETVQVFNVEEWGELEEVLEANQINQ